MSAPFRRPILRDTSSYLDEFEQIRYKPDANVSPAKTLKPPPEIWELVHPVPTQEFKPSQALAARVATKNVLMVAVGIVLASGVGLASWKFHIPQYILAVFAEPETAGKRAVPATLRRSTGESKTIANSDHSSTASVVNPPTEPSATADEVQASAAVEKKPVHKALKPTTVDTDVRSVDTSTSDGAFSVTTPAPAVRPPVVAKTKQQQSPTAQATRSATQVPIGQSLNPTSSSKTANTAPDTAAAKPEISAASSSEAVAPPKTNAPPKPKVIQWP